jgi:hypothetical protein
MKIQHLFARGVALLLVWLLVLLPACFTNNPYRSDEAGKNIYYDTFTGEPKHLDPARAYSEDEYEFMNPIYEPVVQYHFLKRPYVLVPLTATVVPEAKLYNKEGRLLGPDTPAQEVARAVYDITLRTDVRYEDHPAFTQTANGVYRWHLQAGEHFPKIDHPNELPEKATRELRAEDYAYEIKRLAHPLLDCPILALLANYIDGFAEFHDTLAAEIARIRAERRQRQACFTIEADERANPIAPDLRHYTCQA